MNATMTEYYTVDEILGDLRDGFGVSTMDAVLEELESMTRCRNFGDYTQVSVLNDDKFGRISLDDLFNHNETNYNKFDNIKELKEFLDGSDWELKSEDNTYNYGGYLERDVTFRTFESTETEDVVVFFAVHVGLDIRASYTEFFAISFDSYYESLEFLNNTFFLAEATFKVNNEEFSISCNGQPTNDCLTVYIPTSDKGTDLNIDCETYDISTYDREDFKESVLAFLKDNNITIDNDSLTVE